MTEADDVKALIRMANKSAGDARVLLNQAINKLTDAKLLYASTEAGSAEGYLISADVTIREALELINRATFQGDVRIAEL